MLRFVAVTLTIIVLEHNCTIGDAAKPAPLVAVPAKFECTILNRTQVEKLECILDANRLPYPIVNIYMKLGSRVAKADAIVTSSFERAGRKFDYFSTRADYCSSLTSLNANFVLNFVFKEIAQSSNVPLGCPLKEHVDYHLKDLNISRVHLPPFLPKLSWFVNIELIFENQKSFLAEISGNITNVRKP